VLFEQIDVTPDFAQALLDASENVTQRTLRKRRVELLAHDMSRGQFRLTHQPIAIDKDGQVIDGQHRLAAVIKSGKTVPMMIAYDVDASTFGIIDTGAARSPSDALKIAGMTDVNIKASAARLLLAYDIVKGTRQTLGSASKEFTSTDIQAVFDTPRADLIATGARVGYRVASALGRFGIKTWATVVWVLVAESKVGESTRAEFFERLADGALQQPGSPILALRRYVINDTGLMLAPGQDRPMYFIANTIKTLNDYLAQRERSTSVWKPGREDMPMIEVPDAKYLELAAEERERADRVEADRRYRARKRSKAGAR